MAPFREIRRMASVGK
jgi:hypothetical protein